MYDTFIRFFRSRYIQLFFIMSGLVLHFPIFATLYGFDSIKIEDGKRCIESIASLSIDGDTDTVDSGLLESSSLDETHTSLKRMDEYSLLLQSYLSQDCDTYTGLCNPKPPIILKLSVFEAFDATLYYPVYQEARQHGVDRNFLQRIFYNKLDDSIQTKYKKSIEWLLQHVRKNFHKFREDREKDIAPKYIIISAADILMLSHPSVSSKEVLYENIINFLKQLQIASFDSEKEVEALEEKRRSIATHFSMKDINEAFQETMNARYTALLKANTALFQFLVYATPLPYSEESDEDIAVFNPYTLEEDRYLLNVLLRITDDPSLAVCIGMTPQGTSLWLSIAPDTSDHYSLKKTHGNMRKSLHAQIRTGFITLKNEKDLRASKMGIPFHKKIKKYSNALTLHNFLGSDLLMRELNRTLFPIEQPL